MGLTILVTDDPCVRARARKVEQMSIGNVNVPPGGANAHVNNATHTGAAQRQSAAARGDVTGTREQTQREQVGDTATVSSTPDPQAQQQQAPPPEQESVEFKSLGKRNGVERFGVEGDPNIQLYVSDSGVQLQRMPGQMIVGMPDGNILMRDMNSGKVSGHSADGKKLEVTSDEVNKTLSYVDAEGNRITVKPENLTVVVNDEARIHPDKSVENLKGQQFVQQPAPQPSGILNPDLGMGADQVNLGGAGAGAAGVYGPQGGLQGARQEQTPSGLMRTITPDGMMVIGLPNGVAISHGPAGAMAMDSRSQQPIPVQVAMHRRPDGGEEYRYQFNDAGGNLYTLFSQSMDFTVESPDRRVAQMVLPQGNVMTAVRGDNGQYSHEVLPDGSQINRGGAQFAGDRVIMPQGEFSQMSALPFPVSGFMAPAFQEQAARQAQARATGQAGQQAAQNANGQFQTQGVPGGGVNPGGGIPGTPDNPLGNAGNVANGEFSPHPSIHHRPNFPQAEVRPSLWQRFKNFLSGRPSNYVPPDQHQQQWGPQGPQQTQGPWGPPPYAQYNPGGVMPSPWPGQQFPPQQSNNWINWVMGATMLTSVLSSVTLLGTVMSASPWNIGFFPPMMGFP